MIFIYFNKIINARNSRHVSFDILEEKFLTSYNVRITGRIFVDNVSIRCAPHFSSGTHFTFFSQKEIEGHKLQDPEDLNL